jgi:hypothetical protein
MLKALNYIERTFRAIYIYIYIVEEYQDRLTFFSINLNFNSID